jgi:hypothetical protein
MLLSLRLVSQHHEHCKSVFVAVVLLMPRHCASSTRNHVSILFRLIDWFLTASTRPFSNLLRVYLLSPSENTQYFCQLIAFLSNVAHHYRHELGGFEQKVLSLLEERNASLDPKLRSR